MGPVPLPDINPVSQTGVGFGVEGVGEGATIIRKDVWNSPRREWKSAHEKASGRVDEAKVGPSTVIGASRNPTRRRVAVCCGDEEEGEGEEGEEEAE
jgi:hypothetical protein